MQNGSLRRPLEGGLSKVVEDIGRTALHEAAVNGDERTLHILLSGGSDRNAKDNKHGNTPLHEAAWRGYSRCVKALCTLPQPKKETKLSKIKGVLQDTRGALHSALLSTRNAGGFTALHLAAQNGHNQSCREILLAGTDPDVQNNYGDTPLHTACRYGHAGATRILISAKCDPNRTNLNGDTPLHIACAMGRRKLTRILLEAGSNQEIPNGQNEMPRDIAIRKELIEILEILNTPVQIKPPKERDRSSSNSKSVAGDQVDAMKSTSTGAKKKAKEDESIVNWSPYGCHYFPDPRSFPSPKLETLPKEPLKKGEQYYLDLAGNIRKGPIGVGNTCYCGPFFRHIEDKISKNRKSLRKYVSKATERLDNKVEALALRTDDQIEQLARSMMADRIRCEGRQLHLQEWLRRGEAARLTLGSSSKSKKNIENANTLTKCRSLELLDGDNLDDRKLQNSRSFDILDESEVIVHRPADAASPSLPSSGCRNSKMSDRSRISTGDGNYSVSKRLEELLFKTNEILEMDRIMRKKRKDNILSASPKKSADKFKPAARPHSIYGDNIMGQLQKMSVNDSRRKDRPDFIVEEMAKITSSLFTTATSKGSPSIPDKATSLSPEASKSYPSRKELERKGEAEHERSSVQSGASSHPNPSSNSSPFPREFSPKHQAQVYQSNSAPLAHNYENVVEAHNADTQQKFKNLITALRKDYNSVRSAIQEEIMLQETSDEAVNGNQSPYSIYGDSINSPAPEEELSVDLPQMHAMLNCFYQNSVFDEALSSSNNTLKSEKRQTILETNDNSELAELRDINEINELKNRILNGSHWRSEVLKQRQQELTCKSESPELKGSAQKFDVRNGAIRTLKSPPSGDQQRNKVQELVAKLEQQNDDGNYSESSEDEPDSIHQNPISNEVPYYCNQLQSQCVSKSPENRIRENARIIDTRNLIPKDAYFHELPNKNHLQPVAIKKLPDKLEFSESFQKARTRNPLPYVNDYEIPITPPGQSNQFNPAAPSSLPPPSEKLLANRKFPYSNPVDLVELSRINANNYQHLQQPLQLQMPQMIGITPEQAQIERDLNNDSGYSTKICGSSHGPSPSLSGHTDYSSGVGMSSNTIGHHELQMKNNDVVTINTKDCVAVDQNPMPFYIGDYGTSSLV